jgi:hypothetical protein
VSNAAWLKELGTLLTSFPAGQTPSPELFAAIQQVIDETIISILENGGQLPAFILQAERIDAIRERLGEQRVAELASRPLLPSDMESLVPLAVQLCSAFDTLRQTGSAANS